MKALFLFAFVSLVSCDISDTLPSISTVNYKCPDDKIHLKHDVCAIQEYDNSDNILYIKKKCGKNKKCLLSDSTTISRTNKNVIYYQCQTSKLGLLKTGKKCSLDSECITNYCKDKKCSTLEECIDMTHCGKGKYCYKPNQSSTGTCKNYISEGGECDSENWCGNGLDCHYTNSKGKCTKLYSLDVGTKNVYNSELCKTGIISSDGNKECVTFSSASIVHDDTENKDYCQAVCKNSNNNDVNCEIIEDYINYDDVFTNTDGKVSCTYSKGKFDLVEKMKKRYDKIKLSKLLKKEIDYDYYSFYGDKKYAELKSVYDNYNLLLDRNFIKENGKKNGDKKCEYEFWKSTISSSFVNIYIGFILSLLGILV